MDMATALAELGVTEATLDADTSERLDRDGYAPLPGVLSAGQLMAIRARLAELLAAEGDQAGIEVHQEAGADRLADLVNKGPMFQACFTDPRVLACIAHVLGDFKLSSLNFRAARPGHGCQPLHADFGGPVPAAAHPDEVRLIAPAGTVVVFNSHLWHGGTLNRGDGPRRALHSYFTRRANGQQLDQQKYIRPQTLARLSPAARFILDV